MSTNHASFRLGRSFDMLEQQIEQLRHLIEPYYALFLFEQDGKPYDYPALFNKYNELGTIIQLEQEKVFQTSQVFIVKEAAYIENEAIFYQLRLSARNHLIDKLAKSIIFYVMSRKSDMSKDVLQDQVLLDESLLTTKKVLGKLTFIGEKQTWDTFYEWYLQMVTTTVLEEIVITEGINTVKNASKEKLNRLFFERLTTVSKNQLFIDKISQVVDRYVQEWQKKILLILNEDLQVYIEVEKSVTKVIQKGKDFAQLTTVPHYVYVMNNTVYQAVREVLYHLRMEQQHYSFKKGQTQGQLSLAKPYDNSLAVLAVDVLDILCSLFLHQAKYPDTCMEIRLTDILMMRDIKQKLGGEGRRGGYEAKQKQQIIAALQLLQSVSLTIHKTISYQSNQPQIVHINGPLLSFQTSDGEDYDVNEQTCAQTFSFKMGSIFENYLTGSQRQLALLPLRALNYHIYRHSWEKQLCRYLSWRWRTQASQGNYWQSNKVNTLLAAIGEKLNERVPSRSRERFEKALDQLVTDQVIADWYYANWEEEGAIGKGWGNYWLNASVIIEPPQTIIDTYRSLEKNVTKRPISKKENEQLAQQLAAIRKKRQLTLAQVGEMLQVSAAYVSQLERNLANPSAKIKKKLQQWLSTESI